MVQENIDRKKKKCQYWCPGCVAGNCPLRDELKELKEHISMIEEEKNNEEMSGD